MPSTMIDGYTSIAHKLITISLSKSRMVNIKLPTKFPVYSSAGPD